MPRALQTLTAEPFLHVQMDAFLDMLPEALQDHVDGFSFETVLEDGKPSVVIRSGPVGARTMRGMRHAIAAMAGQGNNLIVDDVIFNDELSEYVALLSGFDLHLVGVMAPLEVLEAREMPAGRQVARDWRAGSMTASTRASATISKSTAAPPPHWNAPGASSKNFTCRRPRIDRGERQGPQYV